MASSTVVVVGGTRGLGREVAQSYADQGRDVVVTGRDAGERGDVRRGDRRLDARRRSRSRGARHDRGRARRRRRGPVPRPRGDRAGREHRARLRHRGRAAARHAQARRLHRGHPLAPPAARRRIGHPHLRRPRSRPAVSRIDDGHDGERRSHEPGADARDRAGADARERASSRDRRETARSGATCRPSVSRRSSSGRRPVAS